MVTKDGEPIKILLAEDDPDDRELFHEALIKASSNALFTSVENGEKLMSYLAQADGQHPDIIFLDINMPLKDGKQCLKEIRDNRELDRVPVIIFSTSNNKKDVEEVFANGANLYVSKPVFFDDEVKILQQIFSLNWQEDLLKPDKERFILYALIL